jgi:ATPase subunit of ABC transporter with duplicated ATPase domains
MSFSIVCTGLTHAWPDGTPLFDGLDLTIGSGRTGLIGANGAGKSTLLRIIAGEVRPGAGSVSVDGRVGYLPQDLALAAGRGVDEVLGIAAIRTALHAIEAGDAREAHFAVVGDAWDVEERARATLDRLGLGHVDLDRRVGQLSGGEAMLVGLAARFLWEPDVLLLDEPTNNLDLDARERLYEAVAAWPRGLVAVSHDRALLERVDQIADLSEGRLRWYGGGFTAYEEAVAAEREAAERTVRTAEAEVKRQRRELADARIRLDRRQRYGRKMEATKREPKVIMQERKRQAQVSAGKYRNLHLDRLAAARARLSEAQDAVRDETEIRVDLPETAVPAGRTVLTCAALDVVGSTVDLVVRGPERVALIGANGAGKTTLLRLIAGESDPAAGTAAAHVPGVRYLPQRLDVLDESRSVLDNARRYAPRAAPGELRARLARFQFRGDRAGRRVGTLSGGERFRAALAALLVAEPPPQLLLLDEPTNNLDLSSVRRLEQALAAYRGALVVAAHDLPFLRAIGITRWVRLERGTGLLEVPQPP